MLQLQEANTICSGGQIGLDMVELSGSRKNPQRKILRKPNIQLQHSVHLVLRMNTKNTLAMHPGLR